MENNELKKIKKIYGEKMMHLCRKLFPTLLEKPYLVYSILEENIAHTRFLASDIIEKNLEKTFKNYIYSFKKFKREQIKTDKTPYELLREKGYILYECKTEDEIQKFKKYYQEDEELCTFRNNRLDDCYVFFAVKENVEEIKRENFKNPERQDEYGTSVISIQFSKGEINTLSIKNRYNHTVNNPDATFSNNLENIISGLTYSFEKYYKLNINEEINYYSSFFTDELKYVKGNDNKYYKYNYEINNIYYCENNIIIDNGNVIDKYNKEKERYILIDYFIIDKKEKEISLYDQNIQDGFINSINDVGIIKNIISTKNKIIIIEYNNGKKIGIVLNKNNCIISYKNSYVQTINNNFLRYNEDLISIELPNVENIDDKFLYCNKNLTSIKLPKVKNIGSCFLCDNEDLISIELPNVENIDDKFLYYNKNITIIKLPKVKNIGNRFLFNNGYLIKIELPKVEIVGDRFIYSAKKLTTIELPNVKTIGAMFLSANINLISIELPKVESIGKYSLYNNQMLTNIELPNIKNIGCDFLICNPYLEIKKEDNKIKIYKK